VAAQATRTDSQGHSRLGVSPWPLDPMGSSSADWMDYDGETANSTTTPPRTWNAHRLPSAVLGTTNNYYSGELQNNYCRYSLSGSDTIRSSALFVPRMQLPSGSTATNADKNIFEGAALYHEQAAASATNVGPSRKQPYTSYNVWAEKIRLLGKDFSLVPEFRISDFMDHYITASGGNFLKLPNSYLGISGSGNGSSGWADSTSLSNTVAGGQENFYKIYSTSDFLKLFNVINDTYSDERLINGKVFKKNRVALQCKALLKFLPYKGFYPVERTIELARLFHKSSGSQISASTDAAQRAIIEPLFAPGILYNTVKSGIAVDNYIIYNTGSAYENIRAANSQDCSPGATEQKSVIYGVDSLLSMSATPHDYVSSYGGTKTAYRLQRVPFEALAHPANYLSENHVSGSKIFDTGLHSASIPASLGESPDLAGYPHYCQWTGLGDLRYEAAADNFLCETVNFFQQDLVSFVSKREDQFLPVVKDEYYSLTLELYRTRKKTLEKANTDFAMWYGQPGFGYPCVKNNGFSAIIGPGTGPSGRVYSANASSASFQHVTPCYYEGFGQVTITYKANFSGAPRLDMILAEATYEYFRKPEQSEPYEPGSTSVDKGTMADWAAMQISASFNLQDSVISIIPGTQEPNKRWAIQSKFETPVINIADSSPTGYIPPAINTSWSRSHSSADGRAYQRGIWLQYGVLPQNTKTFSHAASKGDLGIFAKITTPSMANVGGTVVKTNSLAEIVGMPVGDQQRVGEVKQKGILEEAVVAIPFKVGQDGKRKFFEISRADVNRAMAGGGSSVLRYQINMMRKYVFPPTLDFVTYNSRASVIPTAMYCFQFGLETTQQDYADMWQNLPPGLTAEGTKITAQTATVEHSLLASELLTGGDISENLRWMVFKVKKRAVRNFQRFKKAKLTADISTIAPDVKLDYSYNWPYDYFSIIELVKMDAAIEYSSMDEST